MPIQTLPSATINETETKAVVSKAEQTRRTRDLIIKTGIHCIAKYGYVATSMNLISKEAGISRGPLHYHFKDKNDLMGAIAEALPTQGRKSVLDRLQRATSIEERIDTLLDIAIEEHLQSHHLVAIDLLAAARRDASLAREVLPHFTESERRVDEWWYKFGEGLGWSQKRLRGFRAVFIAALRGLALDYSAQTDEARHEEATAICKEMLRGYMLGPK